MSIGHHPQHRQYEPDMRKSDTDISEHERAEAKRRIGGSITPSGGVVPLELNLSDLNLTF